MSFLNLRSLAARTVTSGSVNTIIPSSIGSISPSNLVLDNSVVLAASASSADNYYNGYTMELTKILPNGKSHVQQRRIIQYVGASKRAVIDGVWDSGLEPRPGDTYKLILGEPDTRITINPVMQVFDYITSSRYGRGLHPENDFILSTVKDTALKCDAKSDVSLKCTSAVSVSADAVYTYTPASVLIWEGTVRSSVNSQYVGFTKCIGKITNKWNSWKEYKINELVYHNNKFYTVTTAGAKPAAPVHTSGTVDGLAFTSSISISKVSGTGPSTLSLDISNGNPVLALNSNGAEISGYSLYDSDSVDYWRLLGWDQHSQNCVTQYQTNFTIDTSTPMFDNINMMFEHFNGIFVYSQGRYAFKLEEIETEFVSVTEEDIIGKISFVDSGISKSFNSVSVSYTDPANNFESKNLSLFSETFLKQDRNVSKKGNITVVGCTNYYNVRLLADSYLKKSRRDASISLTLFPEFIVLEPGSVIGVTYPRYKWDGKPFRVNTMTIKPDGLIEIVADEYDSSFYSLTNMNKTPAVANRSSTSYTAIPAPTNLKATNDTDSNEQKDGIIVSWTNQPGLSLTTDIEIQASDNNQAEMTAITISDGTKVTFSAPHGLLVGNRIKAISAGNGIIPNTTYYVKTVVNPTTITLSSTLNGTPETLTNGTELEIKFDSFFIVGTISYPETQFLHTFPNITDVTTKYYRVRYKARKI